MSEPDAMLRDAVLSVSWPKTCRLAEGDESEVPCEMRTGPIWQNIHISLALGSTDVEIAIKGWLEAVGDALRLGDGRWIYWRREPSIEVLSDGGFVVRSRFSLSASSLQEWP